MGLRPALITSVACLVISLPGFAEAKELTDAAISEAISGSDDFSQHKVVFIKATREVMSKASCSLAKLKDDGGWWKSVNHGAGVYFLYCGGDTVRHRFYLNVRTGKVYQ